MHREILNPDQIQLLPLIKQFKPEFHLVGGTAIALHLGHRRSIDFDLFKPDSLSLNRILKKISSSNYSYSITRRVEEQLNLTINNVKITFFEYPYHIDVKESFEDIIHLPGLLELAVMKAFAIGRRSKWKDYVDLYFIIKNHYSIKEISRKSESVFGEIFSEKLFRAQISYFDDIDYSESIEYMDEELDIDEVKKFLVSKAVDI